MPAESVEESGIRTLGQTRAGDRAIGELAGRQHGVVSRRQLLRLGFGVGAIGRRLRAGWLHPVYPGVYAVGHRVLARAGWWTAAVLASQPNAVLSHRSAAALWGLRGYSGGATHVTVPRKSTSSRRIRRHASEVPEDERTVVDGIPVTSVPRTTFDMAATEDLDTLISMLREAEYRNLWDRLSLWDLLERYPGKRGARKLRLALERITEEPSGRKRSRLEERFAPFLRRHRLPLPRFNAWILLTHKRFQVDCHWPDTNQIVELDGWKGHGTRSAFRDDRARDRALRVAGYSVTRLTWNQLEDEADAVAADLRALLGA